ncbi:MAG: YitT family protein [Oscillospiraceae bacterium]|nr:YitT family protein [Oscillospiraceae bacterium]
MKKSIPVREIFKTYFWVAAACLLYALSFNWFFVPNDLAFGGFTGIGQIINAYVPFVSVGSVLIVLNTPLFFIGMRRFGVGMLLSSLFAMAFSSVVIDTMGALVEFQPMDPLLACLYGGVLLGASVGIMMRAGATTGGTELLARLLKRRFANLSMGRLCMIIDFVVIALHSLTFGHLENALYGVLAIFVSAQAMDWVIYGGKAAKAVYIMSDKYEEIAPMLLEMNVGLTRLQSISGYRGKETQVIFTVCRRAEIVPIKQAVMEVDKKAFFVVCDAYEVLGEGFGEYSPDGL